MVKLWRVSPFCVVGHHLKSDSHHTVDKSCSLSIDRPNGTSRTYLTRAEHSSHEDAEAAAAQFALDMGAINFLQHDDDGDAEILERARASHNIHQEEAAVVQTVWGQVYVNMKPTDDGNYIEAINRCCKLATNGRVAPFWGQLTARVPDKDNRAMVTRE